MSRAVKDCMESMKTCSDASLLSNLIFGACIHLGSERRHASQYPAGEVRRKELARIKASKLRVW